MAVNQFETDFVKAEADPSPDGKAFREAFAKMIINSCKDPSPGSLGDVLGQIIAKEIANALPPLLKAAADEVVQQIVAQLTSDPGPMATLLYKRIGDGDWEELNKFGNEIGYKPPNG